MKLDIFDDKSKILIRKPKEIKAILKRMANPNCKRCYGRGYIGTKDIKGIDKFGREVVHTIYIKCGKCIGN